MSLYAFLTGLTSVTFMVTGIYVFVQDKTRFLYKRSLFFSVAVSLWALGYFITLLEIPNYFLNLIASRFSHACGAMIPITYLHFSWSIVKEKPQNKFLFISYIFSGFMCIAALTPLVVKELLPKMVFMYYPEWGILYPVYVGLFFMFPGYAEYLMIRKIFVTHGKERMRLICFCSVLALAFFGGVLLFPLVFNVQILPYWSVLIGLYAPMMAYTIFKYQFMDIEVFIKKTFLFTGIFLMVMFVVSLVSIVTQRFISQYLQVNSYASMMMSALIIVFLYTPTREFLLHITDRFLFQKEIDYKKIALKANRQLLTRKESVKHQLQATSHFLVEETRVKSVAIYLVRESSHEFVIREHFSDEKEECACEKVISFDSPVVVYLKNEEKKPYLELNEVERFAQKYRKSKNLHMHNMRDLYEQMQKLQAHLIVPSFYQSELYAIFVLGEKRSEEFYNKEDIYLYQTIAQEQVIAFEYAKHYEMLAEAKDIADQHSVELKKAQTQLVHARQQTAIHKLSGGIAHEVGGAMGPLTTYGSILGSYFTSITNEIKKGFDSGYQFSSVQMKKILTDLREAGETMLKIKKAARRVQGISDALLQSSKGEEAQMAGISIRTFLDEAVIMCTVSSYNESIDGQVLSEPPEVNVDRDLPLVRVNTYLLHSVFNNLFENALYALRGNPNAKIRIMSTEDKDEENMVRIEFSDNGSGISPDVLPHIFDYKFTTKGKDGHGEGLFNVKTVIEDEHQGKIDVVSELGKGTKFIIKIPAWRG